MGILDFVKNRPGAKKVNSASGPQVGAAHSGDMNIKPKGDDLATRIKKGPLYLAVALAAIGGVGIMEWVEHSS
ncbi:MAG: hypothetical protein K0041_08940, partial [Acidithiobacillus sp.]|nr:hypothetical protein [Acidithiobacillus sp.]